MAIATAAAAFVAADSVAVTWAGISSNPPTILTGVVVTDGAGPVTVDLINVSNTGATVRASQRFTGTVGLVVID